MQEALEVADSVLAQPVTAAHLPLRAQALELRGRVLQSFARLDDATVAYKAAVRAAIESRSDAIAVRCWIGLADIDGDLHEHLDAGSAN